MTAKTNSTLLTLGGALLFFILLSCQSTPANQSDTTTTTTATTETSGKSETEKYKEWVENNPTATDKSEANDEIDGTLYRNNKYKFRIRFLDNWAFRKGDSRTTLIKSAQADSGKSISVIVEDFPNVRLQNKTLTPQELKEQEEQFANVLRMKNIEPINLQMENGYLNNYPALIITFNQIVRSQTMELEYAHKQIHCIKDGKLYNISISMPDAFFDNKENKRLNRVFESFVFEDGM